LLPASRGLFALEACRDSVSRDTTCDSSALMEFILLVTLVIELLTAFFDLASSIVGLAIKVVVLATALIGFIAAIWKFNERYRQHRNHKS
jgi:hypothetical protein